MLSSVFAPSKPRMGQWLMRKSAIVFACILAFGLALQVKPASAQGSTTAKTPQSTTSKAPAAKKTSAKASAPAATASQPATLKDQKEKASYALGMSIGTGMHRQALPVDPALVSRGLRDAMAGARRSSPLGPLGITQGSWVGPVEGAIPRTAGHCVRTRSGTG